MLNIHPLFVHFPIAFLSLYVFIEILPKRVQLKNAHIIFTKVVLLIAGTIGTWVAFSTGDLLEEAFEGVILVGVHSLFAIMTIWIFTILSFVYLWDVINKKYSFAWMKKIPKNVKIFLDRVSAFFLKRTITLILTLSGFLLLLITGALGAAIVYGPDIDPVVSFIYNLFL